MPPIVIGLVAGAAQAVGNEQKEAGQRYLAANTARFSPWTKMQPQPVQYANPVGDIAAGGLAGALYSQQNPSSADTGGYTPSDPTLPNGGAAAGAQSGLQGAMGTPAYDQAMEEAEPKSSWSSGSPTTTAKPGLPILNNIGRTSLNSLQRGNQQQQNPYAALMFNRNPGVS